MCLIDLHKKTLEWIFPFFQISTMDNIVDVLFGGITFHTSTQIATNPNWQKQDTERKHNGRKLQREWMKYRTISVRQLRVAVRCNRTAPALGPLWFCGSLCLCWNSHGALQKIRNQSNTSNIFFKLLLFSLEIVIISETFTETEIEIYWPSYIVSPVCENVRWWFELNILMKELMVSHQTSMTAKVLIVIFYTES